MFKHQAIKWDEVAIPEGRSKKACQEMLRRLQASVEKEGGEGTTNGNETAETKSPKTPRKKAPSKKKAANDAEEAEADGDDGPKTPKPKASARKRKNAGEENEPKKSPAKKSKA